MDIYPQQPGRGSAAGLAASLLSVLPLRVGFLPSGGALAASITASTPTPARSLPSRVQSICALQQDSSVVLTGLTSVSCMCLPLSVSTNDFWLQATLCNPPQLTSPVLYKSSHLSDNITMVVGFAMPALQTRRTSIASHFHDRNAFETTTPRPAVSCWDDAMHELLHEDAAHTERAVFMVRHTMSMTIAAAIGRLASFDVHVAGRGRNGRKLLWIVGAREAMEGELARGGWLGEPLAKLCPCSYGWELLLIGPEMQAWEFERAVDCGAGRASSVRIAAHSGTLHSLRADIGGPDAAVLFNSGIGTLLWPLVEPWLPTMVQLLALDVPVLLSCFNAREAYGEELVLKQMQARVLTAAAINPLACSTPLECVMASPTGAEDMAVHERRVAERALAVVSHMRRADSEGRERALYERIYSSADAVTASAAGAPGSHSAGLGEDDGLTVSSRWVKWVQGSAMAASELCAQATIDNVGEMVRGFAKLFAVRNMEGWVRGLSSDDAPDDSGSQTTDRSESLACNAMLIAEAAVEPPLALLALQHGAAPALTKLLMTWAARVTARGSSLLKPPSSEREAAVLSYAGASAADRIVAACTSALGRLTKAHQELRSLDLEPASVEAPMPPTVYRNVFAGEYINVREAPSTQSRVVAQLPQGAELHSVAERSGWLRLEGLISQWALISHPVHGTLLERIGLVGA